MILWSAQSPPTPSGMADRGMGIRLFNSKESLQYIFEEFDHEHSDDEGDSDDLNHGATSVVTSQLRHFVIQVDTALVVVCAIF